MEKNEFGHIVHGGDYNPEQWLRTPEIIDEDIRLMKLAHVNCATVGIFSWSMLEPEENVYTFEWLDNIMDKLHENGISVILATPSGARPAWLAQKYPEVLRVSENGIRNQFGVRHNHCLISPVYREKVSKINRLLAERYKNHPALRMWHISNEYSGECHCELCQQAFREWLKDYYNNDLEELNFKWWNTFWSHRITDWSQINSPKKRGETELEGLNLCWDKFITDSHISFFKNEIAPLRELTPDIPVTTNLMRGHEDLNYQKFAKELDLVSWDNYPCFDEGDNVATAAETAFYHDAFRSMKNGQPFFMMESTPSLVNWHDVNKLPKPKTLSLVSLQAVAHGSDSVQYFQWRKSRGGHEKFHGAVVDHVGNEHTRVFREVSSTGQALEKLAGVVGERCNSRVAVIYDWDNSRAVKHFCGYNNKRRDYRSECIKWYRPFWEKGISVDIIAMDDDFSSYDLVIAPFLYMLKDGTDSKIEEYVENGGSFVMTYLSAVVDKNDLCYLGGLPGNNLKNVFGIWCEETDALTEKNKAFAGFGDKEYSVDHVCDIIHSRGAEVLGEYKSDFYKGMPSITVNKYGKGKAYYVAFRNDNDFAGDFCNYLIEEGSISADTEIVAPEHVSIRKRGEHVFVMNFSGEKRNVFLEKQYEDVLSGKALNGETELDINDCIVLIEKQD